jgi:hypothetical protein
LSQRAMLEFNLDMLHKIRAHPEAFHLALTMALGLTQPRLRDELKQCFGVTFVAQRHHSTAVAVTQNGAVVWSEN